ncbi:hypothetical protein F2Q70_00038661 [Brassica cretica]|uniref:Uncharacterized protein n=1 Tax=Brassica cretica TaxID=69181 RepID=A0A8S9K9E8_BRACR|nr:hypothetical protein F2Q70_00038661 [Brassica cretica]KAF2617668.1 hypothetical protein F2Q68_00039319 [Brassica cretica]
MGDGSLLLDVCLSQQEQWMENELRIESGLLDRYLFQAGSMDGMDRWIWIDSLNKWTNRRS